MPYVFISYVRENSDVVDRLASSLKSRGVVVWLDRNDIEPGALWADAIRRAIREGTFFIACFSKEYIARSRAYMNEELTLAIDELRQRATDQAWFIPVLLTEGEIPDRTIGGGEILRSLQHVALYKDWDDGVRRILRVLKHDDQVSARIYHLINVLEQPFLTERLRALRQLEDSGRAAAEAVPALAEAMEDEDGDVRLLAAAALREIGPAAAEAAPALAKALRWGHGGIDLYFRAIAALREIGPAAVPALVAALNDLDAQVRWEAAAALHVIGPAAAEAVPALAEALKDQDAHIRSRAADALREIGPAAAEAVPALVVALKDQHIHVRTSAASALDSIRQIS